MECVLIILLSLRSRYFDACFCCQIPAEKIHRRSFVTDENTAERLRIPIIPRKELVSRWAGYAIISNIITRVAVTITAPAADIPLESMRFSSRGMLNISFIVTVLLLFSRVRMQWPEPWLSTDWTTIFPTCDDRIEYAGTYTVATLFLVENLTISLVDHRFPVLILFKTLRRNARCCLHVHILTQRSAWSLERKSESSRNSRGRRSAFFHLISLRTSSWQTAEKIESSRSNDATENHFSSCNCIDESFSNAARATTTMAQSSDEHSGEFARTISEQFRHRGIGLHRIKLLDRAIGRPNRSHRDFISFACN